MMSSLGRGMHALSIPMSTAIPPYDSVPMTYTQNPPRTAKIALTLPGARLSRGGHPGQGRIRGPVPSSARAVRSAPAGQAAFAAPHTAVAVIRDQAVRALLNLDEDGRDVVFPPALVGPLDQTPTRFAHIVRARDDLRDLVVAHHSR